MTDLAHQPENSKETEAQVDIQLISALESKPQAVIPADFAARLAARVQTLPTPAPRRPARYGELATGIGFAILLLAMFVLAPWTQPTFTSLSFDLELLLLAQMLGLAAWQMLRNRVRPELSY